MLQTYGLVLLFLASAIGMLYFLFKPPQLEDSCFLIPHLSCRVYYYEESGTPKLNLTLRNEVGFDVKLTEIKGPQGVIWSDPAGLLIPAGGTEKITITGLSGNALDLNVNTTYMVDAGGSWVSASYFGYVRAKLNKA